MFGALPDARARELELDVRATGQNQGENAACGHCQSPDESHAAPLSQLKEAGGPLLARRPPSGDVRVTIKGRANYPQAPKAATASAVARR